MICQQLGQNVLPVFQRQDHFLRWRRRFRGDDVRMVAQGQVPHENQYPDRGQAGPNTTGRPDYIPRPFTESYSQRELADGFRPACRLHSLGPAVPSGLRRLKVR
jgi:hypothetical protein